MGAFRRREVDVMFQDNLRNLREKKGWTQTQAADAAGVSFRSYQNWEIGGREPRLDALKKLAEAFGVTTDELLVGHDAPAEKPAKKRKVKK
jgi:transcriptional regulator with XRE-family HTH domain